MSLGCEYPGSKAPGQSEAGAVSQRKPLGLGPGPQLGNLH